MADTTTIQVDGGHQDGHQRSTARIWTIVMTLNTVLFIAALDQTVVATTIPTIVRDFRSATGYTWIAGAYTLASAVAGPLWTRGSDIWGRKAALLSAVFLFGIASLVAALSVDISMLIAARALQGTACGGLFQLVAITTSDIFSIRERALFSGLQGGVYAVAVSAGPLIGGAFAEYVTWRWIFWINLPFCGLSILLLAILLDVHTPRTSVVAGLQAMDWAGTVSLLAMSLTFLLGLEYGGTILPWSSPTVISLLVVGGVLVVAFVLSEKKLARYPLVPLGIFTQLSNNAVVLVAVGHSMITAGIEFYLPLYFQSVKQQTPLFSGLLLLPFMVTAACTDIISGVLIHRSGRYLELLRIGVVLMTLGCGLYILLHQDSPMSYALGFEVVSAAGVALLFQAPMLVIQNTVKQADVASATASLGFLRSLSTATSIVVGGVLFQNSMNDRRGVLLLAGVQEDLLDALTGDKAAANLDIVQSVVDYAQRAAILDAYAWSIRNIFILLASIGGVTIVASWLVQQGHMSTEHTETRTGVENMTQREKP